MKGINIMKERIITMKITRYLGLALLGGLLAWGSFNTTAVAQNSEAARETIRQAEGYNDNYDEQQRWNPGDWFDDTPNTWNDDYGYDYDYGNRGYGDDYTDNYDEQQWWNPGDWFDDTPNTWNDDYGYDDYDYGDYTYGNDYYTDDYWEGRSGWTWGEDDTAGNTWNYDDSAWDYDDDYWGDDWDYEGMGDYEYEED